MAHIEDNTRFPHKLEIKRGLVDDNNNPVTDENGDEVFSIVFESECAIRGDMLRGIDIDAKVIKSDYKLALPKHSFIIRTGDNITLFNSHTGEKVTGEVELHRVWNLGANIWFQSNGNKNSSGKEY